MIDASLPLNAGRPRPTPGVQTLGSLVALRGGQLENQQRQQQIQFGQRQMETADQQAQAAQQADAQFSEALRSGAIYQDPQMALSLLGPERGAAFINGVVSLQKFMQGQKDVSEKDFQNIILGVQSLPEADRPKGYAMARDTLVKTGAIGEQDVPAQYDPTWAQMQASKGQQPKAPAAPIQRDPTRNLERVNPDGTVQVLSQGTPAPVKGPTPPAVGSFEDFVIRKHGLTPTPAQIASARREYGDAGRVEVKVGGSEQGPELPPDPASADILSQTGLSMNAFMAMTGRLTQLPRDAVTRNRATQEAQAFARKRGVDVSTLASQYKAQNAVLEKNIERLNSTKIMEAELSGTIQNLQAVLGPDPSGVRAVVAMKAWLGQEVNDPNSQQYKFHLNQLQKELAAYAAATQGRSGGSMTDADEKEAAEVIKAGISKGGLKGLQKGVEDSTSKMGPIMQGSVDRAQKAVWSLFGVGQNYKDKGGKTEPAAGGVADGTPVVFPDGTTGTWDAKLGKAVKK
jgi:hypothetical protein